MAVVDLLVAEIGSTTTVINAFNNINSKEPTFEGQGQAPTTVLDGDVTIGLNNAIDDLKNNLGFDEINWKDLLGTSSAAGGLKMTVHGLVHEMTVKAAEYAALGAGAVIKMVTAGKLKERHLKEIKKKKPNIILLAGGVDYGDEDTIIHNAKMLRKLDLPIWLIYGGNKVCQEEVKEIFSDSKTELLIVDNVYPEIDVFNIEPTRKVIQDAFEKHIIRAPGMNKIDEMVTGPIMPTPGAVMSGAKLLKEEIGDLIVFDVGGATTDLHSITEGTKEYQDIMISPEPTAIRTVEGDLGVFINAKNLINEIGINKIEEKLGFGIQDILENRKAIPQNKKETKLIELLTEEAVNKALNRHAGEIKEIYGPSGRTAAVKGKDLTGVKYIIGTGGALTKLEKNKKLLSNIRVKNVQRKLYPGMKADVLIDQDYIFAACGVMAKKYPEAAVKLMKKSLQF
ncbi:MAG: GlmL-related ornithine degradation protein [Bacillota bacterium]